MGELGGEIERLSSVDRLASTKEKLPDVLVRLLSVDEVNYGLSVRIIHRLDSKAKTGEEGVVCVMDSGVRGRGGEEYDAEGRGGGGGGGGTGDEGRAAAAPAPAVEPMHKMLLKDIPRAKPLTLDDDSKPQLPCIAASHTRVTTILALSIKMEMRAFERYAMRETARYVNSLLLEDCNLRDDGAGIIAAALGKHVHFTNTCRATLVSLSNNFITWRGVSAIAGALKTNTRLTALHLDWNAAGAEGGVALARALKGNSTLRLLNLEACGLRDEGVSAIGHALAANRGLTELRISADNATSGGAVAVASSLRVNTALEILDISGNSIGSSSANGGGYQIASAIAESNSTLTDLKVDACGVEAPFFDMISDALKAPRCALRSVSASGNKCMDQGALWLADSLTVNTSLTSLHLRNCVVGSAGKDALRRVAGGFGRLRDLELSGNVEDLL